MIETWIMWYFVIGFAMAFVLMVFIATTEQVYYPIWGFIKIMVFWPAALAGIFGSIIRSLSEWKKSRKIDS